MACKCTQTRLHEREAVTTLSHPIDRLSKAELISPKRKHDHYIRPRCGFGLIFISIGPTNPEYWERSEPSYVTEMSSHYRQMLLLNVTIGVVSLQHMEIF